jgi:hypothetical protein
MTIYSIYLTYCHIHLLKTFWDISVPVTVSRDGLDMDIPDDVLPDPDDLADFELPDQQALIDSFLSQGQVEAVPVTVAYKWTAEELTATIKLIKSTDFKVEDVNVDLHKRVAAAITQGQERRRLLHRNGTLCDRCKAEVCYIKRKYVVY